MVAMWWEVALDTVCRPVGDPRADTPVLREAQLLRVLKKQTRTWSALLLFPVSAVPSNGQSQSGHSQSSAYFVRYLSFMSNGISWFAESEC